MRGSTSCSPFRFQAASYRVSAFGWFFIKLLSIRSILPNLVPVVLFLGLAREKRPGNEVGSWHCKLILLYSEAEFSVAFGSTGCNGSVGGRAPFAPLALPPPGKFVKLDSLKCNSPRFLDQNWVTGKVFKGVKNVHKKRNIWLIWQLSVCSCSFFSWFQNGLQSERVYKSRISRVRELLSRDRLHIRSKFWVTFTVGVCIITIYFKSQSSHCHCYLQLSLFFRLYALHNLVK